MASIRTAIELNDSISSPLMHISSALNMTISSFEEMQMACNSSFDTSTFEGARQELGAANSELDEMVEGIRQNEEQQQRFNRQVQQGSSAFDGLGRKIMGAVGAYVGMQAVGKVFDLSDSMAQTDARLGLIVDDGGSVDELQQKILNVAENTRASFLGTADMISKLGLQASAAFSSNDELLAFSEQLNKNFVVAGTSMQGVDSVMLQMTQAMAAGKLQGEELNAVLDNATPIVQNIQRYLEEVQNIDASNIKQLASDGVLTAEVIKNAMFYCADETNAKFEAMSMTFAQAWTGIQNDLLMTFQPVIQAIGAGAGWIHDNWATIEPIFWGLTAAVGAYAVMTGIQTAATWLSVAANRALAMAMLTNPITWIALAIGVLIGVIYNWIQSVGGIKVAWLMTCNAIMTAWDWVKIGFFTGVYWVMDLCDKMVYGFQAAGVGVQNFMGDMKAGVLNILQNMVNGAIGIINDFIGILNNIPGVSISAIADVTFGTTAMLENEAEKSARNANLVGIQEEMQAKIAERENSLNQMKADAISATAARQAEITIASQEAAMKQENAVNETMAAALGSQLGDIADNTGDIKDSVAISGEDLKYMRDLATRDVVNRYTTAEIKIDMGGITNNVNSNMDLDGVIDYMVEGVNDAINIMAEGVNE